MSLKGFIKLAGKAIRFTLYRPIQRFNVSNRAKKYLGPDAKAFMPAPRAIGSLVEQGGKPSQYPHLESKGFLSVRQRRLQALSRDEDRKQLEDPKSNTTKSLPSKAREENNLVIEAATKLSIIKTVTKLNLRELETTLESNRARDEETTALQDPKKQFDRPMPKLTQLQISPTNIWETEKVPPGRISLNMLQELMLNKLADDEYWTTQVIAERYNIKEEYAEKLIKYLKQIKFVIPPRVAYTLDYIARDDPIYQATKDLIYYVDPALRSERDRMFDATFLPEDDLDENVRRLIGFDSLDKPKPKLVMVRPEPLRIEPMNKQKPAQLEDSEEPKKLQEPKAIKKAA